MFIQWNPDKYYELGAAPGCLPNGTRVQFRDGTTGTVVQGWPEKSRVMYSGQGVTEYSWFKNSELLIKALTFGQFARQLRQQRGLSQDAVAQALGFAHRAQVNHMENDDRPWRLESIQKLAQLFDMTASELLKEFENQ